MFHLKDSFFCVFDEFVLLFVAIEYHLKWAGMNSKLPWLISYDSNWQFKFRSMDFNITFTSTCLWYGTDGQRTTTVSASFWRTEGGLQETGTGTTTTTVLTTTGALCHGHVLETIWQVTGKNDKKKKQKKINSILQIFIALKQCLNRKG